MLSCMYLINRSLDMSFNNIRVIKGLSRLVKLEKLFLINNKLKKIEQLEQLTCLTMLELGDNRIRVSCTIRVVPKYVVYMCCDIYRK